MHNVLNAILFQSVWFSAVLVGWQLSLIIVLMMLFHLLYFRKKGPSYSRLVLIILFGMLFDALLFNLGLFQASDLSQASFLGMPIWLMTIWLAFGFTLFASLSWWQAYPRVFISGCMVAGPLSYWAGMRLNALYIVDVGFLVLCFSWLLVSYSVTRFLPREAQANDLSRLS